MFNRANLSKITVLGLKSEFGASVSILFFWEMHTYSAEHLLGIAASNLGDS